MISAILFLIALLMMLGAVLSVIRAQRQEQIAKVHQRLAAVAFLPQETSKPDAQLGTLTAALDLWLKRVGLNVSPNMALLMLAGVVLMGVLLWQNLGALVGIGMKVSGKLREGVYVPFGPFLAGAGLVVTLVGSPTVLGWLGWA